MLLLLENIASILHSLMQIKIIYILRIGCSPHFLWKRSISLVTCSLPKLLRVYLPELHIPGSFLPRRARSTDRCLKTLRKADTVRVTHTEALICSHGWETGLDNSAALLHQGGSLESWNWQLLFLHSAQAERDRQALHLPVHACHWASYAFP